MKRNDATAQATVFHAIQGRRARQQIAGRCERGSAINPDFSVRATAFVIGQNVSRTRKMDADVWERA